MKEERKGEQKSVRFPHILREGSISFLSVTFILRAIDRLNNEVLAFIVNRSLKHRQFDMTRDAQETVDLMGELLTSAMAKKIIEENKGMVAMFERNFR